MNQILFTIASKYYFFILIIKHRLTAVGEGWVRVEVLRKKKKEKYHGHRQRYGECLGSRMVNGGGG